MPSSEARLGNFTRNLLRLALLLMDSYDAGAGAVKASPGAGAVKASHEPEFPARSVGNSFLHDPVLGRLPVETAPDLLAGCRRRWLTWVPRPRILTGRRKSQPAALLAPHMAVHLAKARG